jgi:radical S-adenosyl methionine domain-containing protein 2
MSATHAQTMAPVSINFHLIKACNLRCTFCYATFRDVQGQLSLEDARKVIRAVAIAGCRKLNFAGGEPTLHPYIGELVELAKNLGMTTSIVTNGAKLETLIDRHCRSLDWAGLSVDSAREETQTRLGRGTGGHVARSLEFFDLLRKRDIKSKLNTVVTALNWDEDMTAFVRKARPDRWKVFHVLPIDGQNDGAVEPLLITVDKFGAFVDRHRHLESEGLGPIAEDNDAMTGSYVMIDPLGRFYNNWGGQHRYGRPIRDVGVAAALADVGWDKTKFVDRGGLYDW